VRKIKLSQAEPDMILAKPVENEKGIVMCGAGTPLTDALIERFKEMDLESVVVEGDEPLDPAKVSWMKKLIEERFSRAKDCQVCEDLKQIMFERLDKRVG